MRSLLTVTVLLVMVADSAAQDTRTIATTAAKTAQREASAERRAAIEDAVTDASLRSPIAIPKFEFAAEIAEDQKNASAKIGFSFPRNLSGEVGFKGAFDKKAARTAITSLRRLTPDSAAWAAVSWKNPRIHFDYAQMNTICLQAAWADDSGALQFDCRLSTLPTESFAARLAEIAATPARSLCQQFTRATRTGPEVAAGAISSECEQFDLTAFERAYGARYTESYQTRYAAKVTARELDAAADLCNEFRRSRGFPSVGVKCDPAEFSDRDSADFARSWQARFASFRSEREAIVCDEYRRAKGLVPTNQPSCTPPGEDPVFTQSFHDRFAATNYWLGTPIVNARVEVGRPSFEFRDPNAPTADATEVNEYSYSVTGTGGWLTRRDLLLALNLTYAHAWKSPDPIELCQPIANTDATKCEPDIVIGPPTSKHKALIELQAQRPIGATALAVFVTINGKRTEKEGKREWGIEAPFYFLKNKEGGLAGGVVFNYNHGPDKTGIVQDTFDISVFIGQVFKAF